MVVNHLARSSREDNVAIAYIYCSYNEQNDQTSANLIASLLQQIVQKRPTISNEIRSLYLHHNKQRTRPTLSDLSSLLQSEIHRHSKVFILIDALDECSRKNGTRDNLLSEIRKLQPFTYLLVTSRHISATEHGVEETGYLEICAHNEDIKQYIKHRVTNEPQLAHHVEKDPTLEDKIINTLAEKAQGM
jgi:hypothetical protein